MMESWLKFYEMLDLSNRGLTSLVGMVPEGTIKLDCSGNQLTSLEGCPSSVEILLCMRNHLTSLEGCPPVKILRCWNNRLTSLKGCPVSVKKLYCSHNKLTSLQWCPPFAVVLYCSFNRLTSLEHCSVSVKKLYCSHNKLTSLQWCPPLATELSCRKNLLSSLEYCPSSVTKLFRTNKLLSEQYRKKSLEEIHAINRVKRFARGIAIIRNLILNKKVSYIQACWETYWYKPNEEGVARYAEYSYQLMFGA